MTMVKKYWLLGKEVYVDDDGKIIDEKAAEALMQGEQEIINEIENIEDVFDSKVSFDIANTSDIESIIDDGLKKIDKAKDLLKKSIEKTKYAVKYSEEAKNRKAKHVFNKGNIEELQTAVMAIAEAQQALTATQKVSFEYQKVLTNFCRYLLFLGTTNIATNRAIVSSIEDKLSSASKKEFSESEKNELLLVIKELKNQQDLYERQEQLNIKVKTLQENIYSLEEEIQTLKSGGQVITYKEEPQQENVVVVEEKKVDNDNHSDKYKKWLIALTIICGVLAVIIVSCLYYLFFKDALSKL